MLPLCKYVPKSSILLIFSVYSILNSVLFWYHVPQFLHIFVMYEYDFTS